MFHTWESELHWAPPSHDKIKFKTYSQYTQWQVQKAAAVGSRQTPIREFF